MTTEKRGSDRVTFNSRVTLTPLEHPIAIKILNLSESGAGLHSPKPLAENQNFTLTVELPGHHQNTTLTLTGKITHNTLANNNYLVGFEFSNLTHNDLQAIQDFFNFHDRLFS